MAFRWFDKIKMEYLYISTSFIIQKVPKHALLLSGYMSLHNNKPAFLYIMYCSAQLYLIPSITKVHGYHWLNTECFCQKYTYFFFSSSNLYLSLSLSTETIMIIHLPSQLMLSFSKKWTYTFFCFLTLFAFLAFVCIGLATFNAVTKPKNIFFEKVIVQPTNSYRGFFLSLFIYFVN